MAAAVMTAQGMTSIMLSGSLAKKFGRRHSRKIDSGTSREVFKALNCTIEGFEHEIKRLASLGMRFAVFRNRKNVGESELDLGGTRELRIVPVIGGSKRGGALQTIVGVVLLAISWAFPVTAPYLTPAGIGLVAGGVIQMLSPQQGGLKQSASPENMPSYAFGSAKNTTASGNPVPICIGERRWGGAIISASIYAEDKA
ncbi:MULTISPECIES: tail assembly protein [unclassified Pseudomonas]|uniref:tail assembly protein n=1 Tax=unclassified Pseudomonas TaxID=196821 RepID=UPI000A1E408F|nr:MULTISPECIES: tail assembly protein [unclassified Pseudomonas]POA52138.1 tail assembly protein [Pseudomonas sp. FW507-12TSA]